MRDMMLPILMKSDGSKHSSIRCEQTPFSGSLVVGMYLPPTTCNEMYIYLLFGVHGIELLLLDVVRVYNVN